MIYGQVVNIAYNFSEATSYGKKENLLRKNARTENNTSVCSFQFLTRDVHCGEKNASTVKHYHTAIEDIVFRQWRCTVQQSRKSRHPHSGYRYIADTL